MFIVWKWEWREEVYPPNEPLEIRSGDDDVTIAQTLPVTANMMTSPMQYYLNVTKTHSHKKFFMCRVADTQNWSSGQSESGT